MPEVHLQRNSTPKRRKQRIDIRTVAAHAGVSPATVSRAMNRVPTVDPKLARRVWASIDELGFTPSPQARALVSGRSRLFGLIVSEITNPFFPELVQGFEEAAVDQGYEVLLGSTNYDPRRMEICIQRMLERNVDGVAVMTFGIEEPLLGRLAERSIPLVLVDVAPPGEMFSILEVNYLTGIRQAVQHLAVLGHRRIAFISGPLRLHSARARKQAFLKACTEIGVRPDSTLLAEGDHTLDGGTDTTKALMERPNAPTAIMCSNDMTAIGVVHALHGRGLSVPQDVSVIGFDNIHLASFFLPPLTTVEMSRRELATNAVLALKEHIGGAEGHLRKSYPIKTQLVVRRSTAVPHGSLIGLRPGSGSKRRKA